jgi:hypothetical protein
MLGTYLLPTTGGVQLSCNIGGTSEKGNVSNPFVCVPGTWYYGAIEATAGGGYTTYCYDYGTSQLYTSPTQTGLGAVTPGPGIWAQLFTNSANYAGGSYKYNGTMDNVKIFNTPLTTGQLVTDAVGTPTYVPGAGDANSDHKVDINDLTIVLTNYGKSGQVWSQGCMDSDPAGTVDINDLTIVLTNYGNTYTAALGIKAVPEPGTLALIVAGLAGLLAYAWRKRR